VARLSYYPGGLIRGSARRHKRFRHARRSLRPAPDAANLAGIVVRNARVYTGDRAQPTASAVAISGGVFTAAGDDAAVAGHVGGNTRIATGSAAA
jgi:hypothetical protein